ncbi:helix-turn-helix transcriptional regulator [Brevibacillus sp. TJ4]|uniref:helix-turn-helix transcriptional regulator n=1 Tax=Brevibacillus sp. TJ4 TaxID=3234853 RepID=UPI0037D811D7
MARESFDKEVQLLRMLVLTSGVYSRKQFAERLGISVHTFDKTIKRLRKIVTTVTKQLPEEQGKELYELLRYTYYQSSDPRLLFLFRAKSLKESESQRLSIILAALREKALTATELIDECASRLPADFPLPDEKTIRGDVKYLEEVGAIRKEPGGRPYRYRIDDDLYAGLTDEEIVDLFAFVDVMANTQVPSLQGFLLRDSLKALLVQRHGSIAPSDFFHYKYHYYTRILDEANLYAVFQAIRQRKHIKCLYLSPKSEKRYASKNTNPLFAKKQEGRNEYVLPVKVIYDHQYGRWYLIGSKPRLGIVKYRMEGLTQIEEADAVSEQVFSSRLAVIEEKMRTSWLVDTEKPVKVKARFYHPEGSQINFVKERVLLQGQWGTITGEDDESFIYEIEVNGTTEIKPWLRSFGSSCEVLEPLYLRREMIQEWKEIQSYYEPV